MYQVSGLTLTLPYTTQTRGEAHACNPSMKDMEVGGSEVQHYPRLHSKFEASLGYKRLSKEIRKKKGREGERREERKEQMNKVSMPMK